MKILALATLSVALGFGQIDDCHTLESCQEALKANRRSSLFRFRIGEIYLERGDYLDAVNEYRASSGGDRDPGWVEVWAHIGAAKALQMGGVRGNALNEFRQALRTGDNTFGAQDEVAGLLKEMRVDVQPRILDSRAPIEPVQKTPPDYTGEARIAELEGTVLLDGIIGDDGLAHDLTVLRSLGLGLDEKAIDSARHWLFAIGPTNGQTPAARVVIAVDFFLSSKFSRWHLVQVDFSVPAGATRPIFLEAVYPGGAGVLGDAAIEEGRLLGGIGRQASARVSFDVDERGAPANIQVIDASDPVWVPQAAILVSDWRFKPGMKDEKPISVRCTIDLIWGTRNLTPAIVDAFRSAVVNRDWEREIDKALKNRVSLP